MANKIRIRRGNEADLPILDQGELGYTLDTRTVYIGTGSGNVKVGPADETLLSTLSEEVQTGRGGFVTLVARLDDMEARIGQGGSGGGDPIDYPGQVTGLTYSNVTTSSINLSWTAATGTVTDYRIQYKTTAGSVWSTFGDAVSTQTTVTVTGLNTGVSYDFRIAALNGNYLGSYSATLTRVINIPAVTAPSAPTGLTVATVTATTATLTWTASAGTVTDYLVQYRQTGASTWVTFADGTSTATGVTISGLTHTTGYDFRVAAVNSGGTSGYTATVTGSTQPAGPPAPPTNFAIKGMTAYTASLTWTAPAGSVTDYIIEYKVSSDSTWLPFGEGTSLNTEVTITGLTPTLSYDFQVAAVNGVGTGTYAATLTANALSDPGEYVRITTIGASFAPQIELVGGSNAVVSWEIEGGSTYTGTVPTINFGSAGTRYIRMRVTDNGINAMEDVRVFNIGFNVNEDASGLPYGTVPSSYNYEPRQQVSTLENVRCMTGLVYLLAATSTLACPIDFSGMSNLLNIECYGAAVTSINLTWCTSLRRLCMENNDISVFDLNPVADCLFDLRSSGNHSPVTFVSLAKPLAMLFHYCSQGQVVINHPTGVQMPAVEEWWDWQSSQSGVLAPRSSKLRSVMSQGNNWTSADFTNQFPVGGYPWSRINLANCSLASINLSGCQSLRTMDLEGNLFNTAAVDGIIAEVVSWGSTGGSLNLSGTNQGPSASGYNNAETLRSRGWTVTLNATVGGGTAPGQVTGLTSTGTTLTSVSINWTAPAGTVTDYIIQYKLHSSSIWSTYTDGTSEVTTATVTGLSSASSYDFRVAAVNGAEVGAYSTTHTVSTTIGAGSLPWSDNFDRPDANGVANIGNGWHTVVGNMSANLVSGDIVIVGNDATYGAIANPTSGSLPADYTVSMTIPAGPRGAYFGLMGRWYNGHGVRVLFQDQSVPLLGDAADYWTNFPWADANFPASWANDSISHTAALRMTGTLIELICDGQVVRTATSSINATQIGTEVGFCGESHDRVRQLIEVSGSAETTAPAAPTGFTSSTVTSSTVTLTWTAPSGAVTDYIVQYKPTSSGTWASFEDGTGITTNTTVTGLTSGTSYDFQVAAVNSAGIGASSSVYTVSTASVEGVALWTDNFDRADATGYGNLGNGWHRVVGTSYDASIVSNELVFSSGTSYGAITTPAGGALPADYTVSMTIPATAKGTYFGLVGRWHSGNGVRLLFPSSENTVTVGNAITHNNSNVTVPTPNFPATWSNNTITHTVAMRMTGSTIDVIIDGQVVTTCTCTINEGVTGTEIGFCGEGQSRTRHLIEVIGTPAESDALWEDTFDRPNATGITNVGNGWHKANSGVVDLNIVSNNLVLMGNGNYNIIFNPAGGALPTDYTVEVGLPAASKGNYFGIAGRWSGGHGVGVLFYDDTNCSISDCADFFYGTWGATFSALSFPASWTNNTIPHTLGLRFEGNTVTLLCDGQAVTSGTFALNASLTGTEVGFCGDGFDRARTYIKVVP